MHAYNRTEADQTDSIAVCATKEEWIEVIEKNLWIPDAALKENDAFSGLVHWLINQGVYE
jgi:hypothetical protein